MHDAQNSFTLRVFKALSDETRLRLLAVLIRHEMSVNELVNLLEMGQSRISRHLKILSEAGLIVPRRDGLWVFYSAATEGKEYEFLKAIGPFCDEEHHSEQDLALARRIIEERAIKTRQFFNTIAEDWDRLNREVLGSFDLAHAVMERMPTPCPVAVDLGCGTGMVLERMRKRATEVIGVDGSSRMLELSRHRFAANHEQVSLRIGELEHLPLRDAESDFASINLVLHHLFDPYPVLQEIRRILQPSGLLLITDFDRHDREAMRTDYGDHWLGFERSALEGMLQDAGFSPVDCSYHPVQQGLTVMLLLARNSA